MFPAVGCSSCKFTTSQTPGAGAAPCNLQEQNLWLHSPCWNPPRIPMEPIRSHHSILVLGAGAASLCALTHRSMMLLLSLRSQVTDLICFRSSCILRGTQPSLTRCCSASHSLWEQLWQQEHPMDRTQQDLNSPESHILVCLAHRDRGRSRRNRGQALLLRLEKPVQSLWKGRGSAAPEAVGLTQGCSAAPRPGSPQDQRCRCQSSSHSLLK